MVSKRRNISEDEPGPSKKQCVEGKMDMEFMETQKKNKKVKSPRKKVGKDDVENSDLEADEDTSHNETETMETVAKPEEATSLNSDIPNWPIAHMSELLRRIENVLPQRDHLVYKSRADRLNWEEIAFDDYSAEQCRIMWETIQKRLRRFRILQELVEDAKTWISKPWTNFYRGNKCNRHPDMPRRPLSTYMIFYMKKKDKVLKENPGLEMTGLSKHIAEMYKKLQPKTKEKYNELAAIQRKEYETKLKEFYRIHPNLAPSSIKSGSLSHITDPLLKKPSTPFKMYCEDKLKKHKDDEMFDKITFLERCKEQWKGMSDKKKVFWINWASERETKYQEDMKKYISENPDFVPLNSKSILTKDERTLRERMAGKPEKPPNSAYSLFSRLMLASEDVKSVSPKERMLLIAQQWKNCNEIEKKEYTDRVKHMLEQYKLQYAEYLESLPEDKRQEELLNNQPKKKKVVKSVKITNPTITLPQTKMVKKVNKNTKTVRKRNPAKSKITKTMTLKTNQLYEGEPEQPPATPYLLFVKNYEANNGNGQNAHEVWENMDEEQRSIHRRILWDMKKLYIESYENFLKGLTQEELKQYSEWKKNAKLANEDSDETSESSDDENGDEHDVCSDDECNKSKQGLIKKEKANESDTE